MGKIWLHRISAGADVSFLLSSSGYMSIGYSCFLSGKTRDLTLRLIDPGVDQNGRRKLFDEICIALGMANYRGRWSLWRFLFEFSEGDMALIPGSKSFLPSIIDGPAQIISEIPRESIPEKTWNGSPVELRYGLLMNGDTGLEYDIGFVRKIKPVIGEFKWIERAYADDNLTRRLKFYGTNMDISDLHSSIEEALDAKRNGVPIRFREYAIKQLLNQTLEVIKKRTNADTLELLVKRYFECIGATTAHVTSKNERGKETANQADADVIAVFEQLNVIVYVQVKKHEGVSDAWAVTQVENYRRWKINTAYASGYEHLAWVVSTGEDFSDDAKDYAQSCSVRLINGSDFAERLLDAGIGGMTLESE